MSLRRYQIMFGSLVSQWCSTTKCTISAHRHKAAPVLIWPPYMLLGHKTAINKGIKWSGLIGPWLEQSLADQCPCYCFVDMNKGDKGHNQEAGINVSRWDFTSFEGRKPETCVGKLGGDIWRAIFQNALSGDSFYAFVLPSHYVRNALKMQMKPHKWSHIAASALIFIYFSNRTALIMQTQTYKRSRSLKWQSRKWTCHANANVKD